MLYFTDSDRTGDAAYGPNWDNAYSLTLRAGTLVKLIRARHGERVGDIFNEIMVSGMARVGDLVERFTDKPDKHDSPQKGSVNGDAISDEQPQDGNQTHSTEDIEAAISVLLRSGLVLPLHYRQFWPAYDLHQEAEIQVKMSRFPAGCNTKKEREACAESVEELMRSWREEYFNFTRGGSYGATTQKHARSLDEDDDVQTAKRQKTNGQTNGVNGSHPNHNNLLDVSLSCTQPCASHRAIAKPLPGQFSHLSELRKMQCRISYHSFYAMGRTPCWKHYVQSV